MEAQSLKVEGLKGVGRKRVRHVAWVLVVHILVQARIRVQEEGPRREREAASARCGPQTSSGGRLRKTGSHEEHERSAKEYEDPRFLRRQKYMVSS